METRLFVNKGEADGNRTHKIGTLCRR